MKETILQYEKDFFSAEFCKDIYRLENRLSTDFVEYGKSGDMYDRNTVIEALLNLTRDRDIEIHNFTIKPLHQDILLVHYLSYEKGTNQRALRTSIWKNEDNLWKMLFHQGTPCDG